MYRKSVSAVHRDLHWFWAEIS